MAALTQNVIREQMSQPEVMSAEIGTQLTSTTIYQGAMAMQVAGKARPAASGIAGSFPLGIAIVKSVAGATDVVYDDDHPLVFRRGVFAFAGLAGDLPTEALIDKPSGVAFADDNTVKATAAANDITGTLRAIRNGFYWVEV